MKNKLTLVLIILVVFTLLSCNREKTSKIEKTSDLQGKVIGMIALPLPAKTIETSVANAIGGQPKEVKTFKRASDYLMAILTGKIDAAFVPKFKAEYDVKRQSKLKIIPVIQPVKMNVVMAVRSEDEQLKTDLDKAITSLQENGAIKRLEDEWVTNLSTASEPAIKEIPRFAGAKTVYVGVCGDLVPLDYIAADGRPAGYNVALMTEIGKLLNINFVFVSIETQAKFAALNSKKIDLAFCNLDADIPVLQALKSHTWVATKPYYTSTDGLCFLVRK